MMNPQNKQALHAKRSLLMISALFLSLLIGSSEDLLAQTKGGMLTLQGEISISNSDRIRGWSWDGRTISYIATEDDGRGGKKSILYVMPFDGKTFGAVSFKYDNFSKSDRIRGWSWDGRTASYIATEDDGKGGKKSILFVRPFDGQNFGPISFEYDNFSKSDRIHGWSWDGQRVVYVGLWQGNYSVYSCSFDGKVFGPVEERVLEKPNNITMRGYQSGSRSGSVAYVKGGKTYIAKKLPH